MNPYKLEINRNIDRWDEAIPLGNGEMGCLVFGSSQCIILALDRGDIWDRSDSPENIKGFTYANLLEWVKTKNTKAIYKTFDAPYAYPTPTKLPAGRIEISTDCKDKNSSFMLDMKTAECTYKNNSFTLKTYTHAENGVGMLKTDARNFDIKIVNPKFGRKNIFNKLLNHRVGHITTTRRLSVLKYPPAQFGYCKSGLIETHYYIQEISDSSCFGIAASVKKCGNETQIAYYAYRAQNADELKDVLVSKTADSLEKG
ncbi:MAG: glycoside hydrolase N-terminal domain-containing protein, partial [Eubacterium sp.]